MIMTMIMIFMSVSRLVVNRLKQSGNVIFDSFMQPGRKPQFQFHQAPSGFTRALGGFSFSGAGHLSGSDREIAQYFTGEQTV